MSAMRTHGSTRSLTRRDFVFGASFAAGGLVVGVPPALSQLESRVSMLRARPRSPSGSRSSRTTPCISASRDRKWARGSQPRCRCWWPKNSIAIGRAYAPTSSEQPGILARGRPWGDMVTSASVSVRASQDYLRRAGAQARQMLIAEAAARWNVEPHECVVRDGIVSHAASGRTLRYGELAEAAARRPIPPDVSLKKPEDWRLIGKRVRTIDTPAKVTGEPIYAIDVRLPDMLYAAVKACPAHGGKLKSLRRARR